MYMYVCMRKYAYRGRGISSYFSMEVAKLVTQPFYKTKKSVNDCSWLLCVVFASAAVAASVAVPSSSLVPCPRHKIHDRHWCYLCLSCNISYIKSCYVVRRRNSSPSQVDLVFECRQFEIVIYSSPSSSPPTTTVGSSRSGSGSGSGSGVDGDERGSGGAS